MSLETTGFFNSKKKNTNLATSWTKSGEHEELHR